MRCPSCGAEGYYVGLTRSIENGICENALCDKSDKDLPEMKVSDFVNADRMRKFVDVVFSTRKHLHDD